MLRQQMDAQQARELARDYLAAVGMSGTPEDYLARVKTLEGQFLALLKQAHNN
jgi:purine nucleoside phosphorylase